jgi:hypothetical protein
MTRKGKGVLNHMGIQINTDYMKAKSKQRRALPKAPEGMPLCPGFAPIWVRLCSSVVSTRE